MSGSATLVNDQNRYIFGITGTVKEIIYPSKAILTFKFNGKEEKAILLVHKYLVDGSNVDEQKLMSDVLKIGDVLEFDGHIYDKGGFGGGKDRCNYYAMRAWAASQSKLVSKQAMLTSKSVRPPVIVGTGFISEVFPRKGVLTFDKDGAEERVLFLASKFYHFEKRLSTKQSLDQIISDGDPVQFEAVPQDAQDNPHFCSWFASLVWKGKKPFEENGVTTGAVGVTGRRGSIGSTGSVESNSTEGSDSLASNQILHSQQNIVKNGTPAAEQVGRGRGYIARILSPTCGLIWWVLQPNHLQSVWFSQTAVPNSLSTTDLRDIFKTGDPVRFVAGRSTDAPTSWVAKEVVGDQSSSTNLNPGIFA
jgi:hypothetical protein